MSAEKQAKKTTAKTWVHKPRVASFTVTTDKKTNKRVFTPVNDRAKKLVKKLAGRRKSVTVTELKTVASYYKLRQYKGDKLVAVRV